jgi:predicted dehydrogenase
MIDEDELRQWWARILVEEAKKPHSISPRTLDVARRLSKEEALLFVKMVKGEVDGIIPVDSKGHPQYISYAEALMLQSAELIFAQQSQTTFRLAYDIDEKQKIRAKGKNIKVFSSPEEIWGDEEIEAVLLAVPNDLHKEYTLVAAKAGKNIICEKPIALSSKEAQEMYVATEKAGVIFSVHQNRRWDEDFLTVKKIIKSKQIGEVYLIESRVMGANGIPGDWRKKKAQGGGMMLDWGVHLIDQALQMIESEVESLYCEYSYIYGEEVEDGCAHTLNFSNGVKYRIVIATDCFRNLPRWQDYGT